MFRHLRKGKMAGMLVFAVAAVAGTSAYAFTTSNTGTAPTAGVSNMTISGYAISNVAYQYNPDTGYIDQVTFDLDSAASDVWVTLLPANAHGGTLAAGALTASDWNDCGASGAGSPWLVTCTFDSGTTKHNGNDSHAPFDPVTATHLQIIADSTGLVALA